MIPKWRQKLSRSGPRDTSKEKQQNFPEVDQKAPKGDQKVPRNNPKNDFQITKNGLGGFFPWLKNDDNLEVVFSCFLLSPGGSRAWKSNQNNIRVCKNEGPTFSRKAAHFYKN